jgi:hypothetical protein
MSFRRFIAGVTVLGAVGAGSLATAGTALAAPAAQTGGRHACVQAVQRGNAGSARLVVIGPVRGPARLNGAGGREVGDC